MKLSLKLLAAFVAVSFCFQASAATITVMNTADTGAGSLRQALLDASDGDTIDFDLTYPATITLTSGQLVVDKSITISGPGANQLAVNGNAASRVFSISSGKTVTISGLTITNGLASGSDNHGGGIFNSGTLTVSNSTISGNSVAPDGSVGGQGGGIFNFNDCNCSTNAILTVSNSTISGNSAADGGEGGGLGGGILNWGTATVTDSTISGNSPNYGGAIYNQASNAFVGDSRNVAVTVTNSTLSGNSATSNGGAILSVQSNGAGSSVTGTVTVTNSTISGNSAAFGTGGIYNGGATLTIGDTILKAGATGANIGNDSGGTVTSLGYNLSSDNGGGFLTATGDQINTDPMLGPLAYYGGPTATHILKTGSPAIDKGDPNFAPPPPDDQRGVGFARVVNGRIDIGAFERQASDIDPTLVVTTTADTNTNGTCDPATPCSLRDAITAANNSPVDDVIYFAVTGTIPLNDANGTLPALDSDMKILGPGANALTIKRDPAAAPFLIFTVNTGEVVTLSGLTVTGGSGFLNGGGISNNHATLTLSNCTVSGNSATFAGGGIYNDGSSGDSATLTITNSTLSGNSARFGGGIENDGSSFGGSAKLTITNSTLSGNSASIAGGGIVNSGGGRAPAGSATLTVRNSTLSDNSGGGILNSNGGTPGTVTLELSSSILNVGGGSGANITNDSGTVTSLGYNLSSDGTGPNNGTTDQINTDPMLGPLADNGGPTFTHAIDCDSPAVDKGSNPTSLTYDQRGPGFDRTVGSATDVGAFELQTACNTAPTITAATGVTLPQDASVSNSSIATVNDDQDAEDTLSVTVNGPTTVNGVTISNIAVAASGNVTADIAATCGATSASFILTVTDSGGLFDEDTLNVAVTPETTPPVISSVSASPNLLKPPNHRLVPVTVSVSDSDNCDPNPVCSIISVTSNEPDTGCGSGDKPNDIQNINGLTVQLRAERCGTGRTGRIYTITVQCTDASGNSSTKTTTVTVKK